MVSLKQLCLAFFQVVPKQPGPDERYERNAQAQDCDNLNFNSVGGLNYLAGKR